jgi:hypothetical protein
MNRQRYSAYRLLLSELGEWRSEHLLEDEAHEELCDAAEGLLLARAGEEAEESLGKASTTVLGMLALDEIDQDNASWVLDTLIACGPQMTGALGEVA